MRGNGILNNRARSGRPTKLYLSDKQHLKLSSFIHPSFHCELYKRCIAAQEAVNMKRKLTKKEKKLLEH